MNQTNMIRRLDHFPPGTLTNGLTDEAALILEARWILAARYGQEKRCRVALHAFTVRGSALSQAAIYFDLAALVATTTEQVARAVERKGTMIGLGDQGDERNPAPARGISGQPVWGN